MAAHQPHRQKILRNFDVTEPIDDLVENSARYPLKQAALPFLLNPKNHVQVAGLLHFIPEPLQRLRRPLQIAVDQKHVFPPRVLQAGHLGLVVTEVPGKINHPDPLVLFIQFKGQFQRRIGRPVIDQDHFIVVSDVLGALGETLVKFEQVEGGIV